MSRGIFYRDIPHYYGDLIRWIFLLVAVGSAVAIPLIGDLLPFGLLAQVLFIALLVLLAGLTHPHGRYVMWFDLVVSGVAAILIEYAAIVLYAVQSLELFWVREFAALAFFVALYYSIKTVRAMVMHRIGHADAAGEFSEE